MDMVRVSENLGSQMKVENVKFGSICFTFSTFIDVPTTCHQMQHQHGLKWSLIDLNLNKNLNDEDFSFKSSFCAFRSFTQTTRL